MRVIYRGRNQLVLYVITKRSDFKYNNDIVLGNAARSSSLKGGEGGDASIIVVTKAT
jgi:hypothetical protein